MHFLMNRPPTQNATENIVLSVRPVAAHNDSHPQPMKRPPSMEMTCPVM